MDTCGRITTVWAVEHALTHDILGTNSRMSMNGVSFGGRVPLYYQSLRAARDAWLKHACDEGYIVRNITLPGRGPGYRKGPNFDLMPRVRYPQFELVPVAISVEDIDIA